MFDCHVHTLFSTDSDMRIEEAIKASSEKGLGIIITEHMDLLYPDSNKFVFDVDDYFKTYEKYRGDKLHLGIEMGMRADCIEQNKLFHENYDFDYIIGSIHLVNGMDIYEEEFYEKKSKRQAYNEYFSSMLECIKSYDFIDCLGHIDYIARYARAEDKEIYYSEFKDYIDEILKYVIKREGAIEINTRRLGNKKTIENLIEIYKRFSELGGLYVTLGSDSHVSENIGSNFEAGTQIAEICGLNIVYFKERKMILSK